jgi:23S rRNA (pseudouridine1915-N3)-methyltransferase
MIAVVAVGKLRPAYRAAADEYLKRLGRFTTVGEHEVREASRAPTPESQRAEEAERLLARVPRGAAIVALARTGTGWTSAELAQQVERWRRDARPVALLIGGSHGLDDTLVGRAGSRWSLGPLTLPHELARVIVYEQLYRAHTMLAGMPYHKGRER